MKTIPKIFLSLCFACTSFDLQAADVDESTKLWAAVPFSKCTTVHQKMKCAFAQQSTKLLSPVEQVDIQLKRSQNRANPEYVAPIASAEALTPAKTAIFMQFVKTKAIDTE